MRPTYTMMALLSLTVPLFVLAGCASQDEMSALRSEVTTSQEMARSAQSQAAAAAAQASAVRSIRPLRCNGTQRHRVPIDQ